MPASADPTTWLQVSLTANFNSWSDFHVTGEITTSHCELAALSNMEVKLPRTRKKEMQWSILIGWQDWWPWQLPIIGSSQVYKGRWGQCSNLRFTPLGGEPERQWRITTGFLQSFLDSPSFHPFVTIPPAAKTPYQMISALIHSMSVIPPLSHNVIKHAQIHTLSCILFILATHNHTLRLKRMG